MEAHAGSALCDWLTRHEARTLLGVEACSRSFPDVWIVTDAAGLVGVEASEIVDQEAARHNAQAKKAGQTRDYVHRVWDTETLHSALSNRVIAKADAAAKRRQDHLTVQWPLWLLLVTSEFHISADLVRQLPAISQKHPFQRIFLMFGYGYDLDGPGCLPDDQHFVRELYPPSGDAP